ncbi:MAG: flavin reductase family protein [Longicatena sp.]
MKEIRPEELHGDVFTMIGKEWMLITAAQGDQVNTMTASWGGLGILWNKHVAYIFIRPQRYTKEFIDQGDTLSLAFFDESERKMLSYMGSVSGKEEDKITKSNLHVAYENNTPYFEEANTVLLCRKLYAQELKENCFIDKDLLPKNYPLKDYHTMYVVEIEKVLTK